MMASFVAILGGFSSCQDYTEEVKSELLNKLETQNTTLEQALEAQKQALEAKIAELQAAQEACKAECAEKMSSDDVKSITLEEEHISFAKRLYSCFWGISGYWIKRCSNEKLAEELTNRAYAYSSLLGFDINVSVDPSVFSFEDPNLFCFESFLFAMICFGFMARRRSAARMADIVFYGRQEGVCFNFNFDICSDDKGVEIIKKAEEIYVFRDHLSFHSFPCRTRYIDGRLEAECYTWKKVMPSDLKTPLEFDYGKNTDREGEWICLDPITHR